MLTEWCVDVAPRLGIASLGISAAIVDRTAPQVVSTSKGRLPSIALQHRVGMLAGSLGKVSAIKGLHFVCLRELKFGIDRLSPAPGVSTMAAYGLTSIIFQSAVYNVVTADTYAYFGKHGTTVRTSPVALLRQNVAPGVAWCFLRECCGVGGALILGPQLASWLESRARTMGTEPPHLLTRLAGGLCAGAFCSLGTQWLHNVNLIACRMAALGEAVQAPHYTGAALATAWRELGPAMFCLNFRQRAAEVATRSALLNLVDVFHRPELSWT